MKIEEEYIADRTVPLTPPEEETSALNSKPMSSINDEKKPHLSVKVIQFKDFPIEEEREKADFENSPMIKEIRIEPPSINVRITRSELMLHMKMH